MNNKPYHIIVIHDGKEIDIADFRHEADQDICLCALQNAFPDCEMIGRDN